jgi:hypothetical protein
MKMIRNRDIAQSEKENNERRKRKTTGALRLDAGCSMSKLQTSTSKHIARVRPLELGD